FRSKVHLSYADHWLNRRPCPGRDLGRNRLQEAHLACHQAFPCRSPWIHPSATPDGESWVRRLMTSGSSCGGVSDSAASSRPDCSRRIQSRPPPLLQRESCSSVPT